MRNARLENGWVRLDSAPLSAAHWLEGFPQAQTDEERDRARGPEGRVSPIYDNSRKSGGIRAVQWVNFTTDKAVVMIALGGWREGGDFQVWYSPGVGQLPRDITNVIDLDARIEAGDPDGWMEQVDAASDQVERIVTAL